MVLACLNHDSLTIIYQTGNREQKLGTLTVLDQVLYFGQGIQ